ncbi:MFS transporter, partial [Staphylococcus sp. 231237_7MaSpsaltlick]
FYATPSMDTVVANSNQEHIGMASGVYKMSSSLGNAFGVALSSTLYLVAKSAFNVQFGAFLGFAFNIALAFIALIIVFIAIPNSNKNYN